MSFPVTFGDVAFAGVADLAAHIEHRALHGLPEHPGDGHPVDWYKRRTESGAPGRPQLEALWRAATELVVRSDDVLVLGLAFGVCSYCEHVPLFEALLDRLEGRGRPLPKDPILQSQAADLGLQDFVVRHAALGPRFRAVYERGGSDGKVLTMLLDRDPGGELLKVLQRVVGAGSLPQSTAMRLAWVVMDRHPTEIVDFATAIATLPEGHRKTYLAEIRDSEPAWFAEHEASLRRALNLPGR